MYWRRSGLCGVVLICRIIVRHHREKMKIVLYVKETKPCRCSTDYCSRRRGQTTIGEKLTRETAEHVSAYMEEKEKLIQKKGGAFCSIKTGKHQEHNCWFSWREDCNM